MSKRLALSMALVWSTAAVGLTVSLVSVEQEIEIGKEAQAYVREQVPELGDGEVSGYVQDIGRKLVAHAPGPEYPYSFSVANYKELNAFALPGGPVWIHRGAIRAAGNESQMVGVLAHEIAHIAQRHTADRLTKSIITGGLLELLSSVLGEDRKSEAARLGAGLFAQGLFLKFSRDDEREADRVGLEMMDAAGWDPRGMVEFMQVLRAQQGRDPSAVEVFLSTHPSPEGRVDEVRAMIDGRSDGRRDSRRFQQVHERLDRLPPAESMRTSDGGGPE